MNNNMSNTFDNDTWDYLNQDDEQDEPDIDMDRDRHNEQNNE